MYYVYIVIMETEGDFYKKILPWFSITDSLALDIVRDATYNIFQIMRFEQRKTKLPPSLMKERSGYQHHKQYDDFPNNNNEREITDFFAATV